MCLNHDPHFDVISGSIIVSSHLLVSQAFIACRILKEPAVVRNRCPFSDMLFCTNDAYKKRKKHDRRSIRV